MTMPFVVVDVHRASVFSEMELGCPTCGSEFIVDTETELNMLFLAGDWVPECPECGHTHLAPLFT